MPGSGPGPHAVLGGVGAARGGNTNVYVVSSDGKLHALNAQDGTDMVPPIAFLPPGAKAVGLILIDTVLYAATTDRCGGAPNALWAIELANDANSVTNWQPKAAIIGDGPAFGPDGTIYLATGAGESPQAAAANSIVALDPKTLKLKSSFTAPRPVPFTSSPIVLASGGKTLVAAASKDGRIYIVDGAAALVTSTAAIVGADGEINGLARLDDGGVTRVVASVRGAIQPGSLAGSAGTNGGVAAFTLFDENGKPMLKPGWVSRDLLSPLTPLVVNNVVFALSSGSDQASKPAVLYALDGATGKDLWTSAGAITSPVRGIAPAAGDGQVYVVTSDGTLYAFGMPMER
jgi:outer membrane protein assembly factor BamB